MYELGFIGAGNMAEAIAKAAISKGVLRPDQMVAADINEQRRQLFSLLGVPTMHNNSELIQRSKAVLLAVKPQTAPAVARDLAIYGSDEQVIISIMAGITTSKLAQDIVTAASDSGDDKQTTSRVTKPRIVRVMPNTPLQVGYGMAGICLGDQAREGDEALALRLFSAGGQAVLVHESKLDAITAISGSGPAYVFYLAEAIQRAAEKLDLGDISPQLVRQTILGAAHLLAESGEAPAVLRAKVTSPGGTTEAASKVLDAAKTQQTIVKAIEAAFARSAELGGAAKKK